MLLLPRMLQSIEVLQLPSAELEAYLAQAAQENEALVLEPPATSASEPELAGGRGRAAGSEASDRHAAWLESQPAVSGGLEEHLLEEVALLDLVPQDREWVRLVVRALDENGYLSASDDECLALAAEEGLAGGPAELGRAIAVVQGLEPRGVGGRNVVEALLLQLDPLDEDYALLCRVLEEFLDEVAKNKLPRVARAMGIDVERLLELLGRLRGLEPAPGRVAEAGPPAPIVPEVIVRQASGGTDGPSGPGSTGGGFEVSVDQSGWPVVRVDEELRAMAKDARNGAEVRGYLRQKIERARWLVEALEERKGTLLRIATALFERQRGFLERGPGHLLPLRMGEVADALGIHLSTVSRAVAGKHAETPWGVLPLRHFFQAEAGGSSRSVTSDVRAEVAAVIEAEDPSAPLSDDEIVAELDRRGLELARRTVAKYRKELGIQSSYRRRRYAS